MNPLEEKIADELGIDRSKPHAEFYDHAIPDAPRTEQHGRPCFKSRVYIRKTPSAPDLVVRNTFSRAMVEADKTEFPDAWARYEKRKAAIANLDPLVTAIPGCGVAQKAELDALRLYTCGQLAAYDKPLQELEPLRVLAKRIAEISREVATGDKPVQPVHMAPVQNGQTFHYAFQV